MNTLNLISHYIKKKGLFANEKNDDFFVITAEIEKFVQNWFRSIAMILLITNNKNRFRLFKN